MKTQAQYFYKYSLFLLVFVMPWQRVASSGPMILFCLASLFYALMHREPLVSLITALKTKYRVISFLLLYFVITLVGLLFAKDIYEPIKYIQLSIISFLLPMAFLIGRKEVDYRLLARVFVFSNILFFFVALVVAYVTGFEDLNYKTFFYEKLYLVFKVNPISASYHYNIALALVLFLPHLFVQKKYVWFSNLVLLMALVFTSSRIGILFALVQLTGFGILYFRRKKKVVKPILIAFITIIVFIGFVSQNEFLQARFLKTQNLFSDVELPPDERNHRIVTYEQAIELIKEKPILGYGTGATKYELKQRFIAIEFRMAEWRHYNAHNQFLESWIEFGLVGIVFWIVFFSYLFYISIKHRDPFSFVFTCLFLGYSLIETPFKNQSMFVLSIMSLFLMCRHLVSLQAMEK